jgi:hypothetical protein
MILLTRLIPRDWRFTVLNVGRGPAGLRVVDGLKHMTIHPPQRERIYRLSDRYTPAKTP